MLVVERRIHFLPFLRQNEDLFLRLLSVLCSRLRRTSMALEEIALFDLPVRLARVLLKLAEDYGRASPGGTQMDLKLSQRDLSNLVAATARKRGTSSCAHGGNTKWWTSKTASSSCAGQPN